MRVTVCLSCAVLLLSLLVTTGGHAAEEAAPPSSEQFKSSLWWSETAARYAKKVQDPDLRNGIYKQLVYAQAHSGELQGADFSASQISDPYPCVMGYSSVAKQYHKLGQKDECHVSLEQARRVIQALDQQQISNFIYSHLIRVYLDLDMVGEAKALADSLPGWHHRDLGLRQIATELARQGQLDIAIEMVRKNLSTKSLDVGLADLAIACAREARVDDTERILGELTDSAPRDQTYAKLVKSLCEKDRLAEAKEAVAKITSPEIKLTAMADILSKLADAEDADATSARIAQASTREEKLALYKKLIEKLTAAKRLKEAVAAIEAMVSVIEESPRRPVSSKFGQFGDDAVIATAKAQYLPIARLLAKQGEAAEAHRLIEMVAEPTEQLSSRAGLSKAILLMQLASTQLELGDLEGVRSRVEKMDEDFNRSTMASHLAAAFVRAGDIASAMKMVALIPKDSHGGRATCLRPVIEELSRADELDVVKQILLEHTESRIGTAVYQGVGRAMIETDRGAALHAWLVEMPSDAARAYASVGATVGLNAASADR